MRGRPGHPEAHADLSDEVLCERWVENPYFRLAHLSLLEGSATREATPGLHRGQKVCPTRAISITLKINTPWDLRCGRGP